MKRLWIVGVAMALCACASVPKKAFTFKQRTPKAPDCRVDVLAFVPSEGYDDLGVYEGQSSSGTRGQFSEEMRKIGCKIGADAMVYESGPSRRLGTHSASALTDITVHFLARPQASAPAAPEAAPPEGGKEEVPTMSAPSSAMPPAEQRAFVQGQCFMNARACLSMADAYENGRGREKNVPLAAALYAAACQTGAWQACTEAGLLYETAPELSAYRSEALPYYRVACRYADARACERVDVLLSDQTATTRSREVTESNERGCERGAAMACNNFAWELERGKGVPRDLRRAVSLYQKACDAGLMLACQNLAVMRAMGRGTARDTRQAATLFKKSCDSGSASACNALAQLAKDGLAASKELAEAASTFEASCAAGQPTGCLNLGWLYETGEGKPRDVKRAIALYEQSCSAKLAVGCSNAASLLDSSHMPESAQRIADLYRKACALGLSSICQARTAATEANAQPLRTLGPTEAGR